MLQHLEQRQREQEADHEQEHEHMKCHNDPGVITFFRAIFPAKASPGKKRPESFPLSQPSGRSAMSSVHEACVC
jgi:hypothetical protein